jgi:hypothetical protein
MDAEAGEFEAVKELERLRAERDRLEKQLALEQQASAALREGLKPFADYGRHLGATAWPTDFETVLMEVTDAPNITVADMRRAAELLASTEGGS